jgi:hexosaminidase
MRIPFLMFLFSSILAAKAQTSLSLMPVPKNIEFEAGRFQLSSGFTVSVKADNTDTILYRAANRMYRALNRRTELFFLQEEISPKNNSDKSSLVITVKQKTAMAIGVDESYEFQIIANNQLRLNANTTIGALRGMETILQLESVDESAYMPAVKIKDVRGTPGAA